MRWWAAHSHAWEAARANPQPPKAAITGFVAWAEGLRTSVGWPVMVAFPAAFDAMWVEWYCHRFAGASPFRRRCIDLRTVVMVAMGAGYREGGKSSLPEHWRTGTGAHTHLAVDDAQAQGRLFFRIVRELGVQRGDVALALEPPARAATGARDFRRGNDDVGDRSAPGPLVVTTLSKHNVVHLRLHRGSHQGPRTGRPDGADRRDGAGNRR